MCEAGGQWLGEKASCAARAEEAQVQGPAEGEELDQGLVKKRFFRIDLWGQADQLIFCEAENGTWRG